MFVYVLLTFYPLMMSFLFLTDANKAKQTYTVFHII